MPTGPLSTTAYSILGMLAVQDWSAYELTKQMGRTLHHYWRRAESGIYREVKRLVDAGLATAEDKPVGRRRRTVYSITEEGRVALRDWLADPVSDGLLDSEGLVRVLFAEHGTKGDLLGTLAAMREDADTSRRLMIELVRDYSEGRGEFPRRAHVNVLVARFLVDFSSMMDEWSGWAEEVVAQWPDPAPREPDEVTLGLLRETLRIEEDRRRAVGSAERNRLAPADRADPVGEASTGAGVQEV